MSGEGSLFDVPPAAIGRFRVLHQVGAGTSGPVFRAAHPQTDAPLAIKLFTLPFQPERSASVVADLESLVGTMPEAEGVCQLIDAGTQGTTPFLVTSFAQGDSLDVALKQFGPAAIADLVPRLRMLARALDAAAAVDVFHGALHPRDVLVSDTSTVLTGLGAWPILSRAGERLPMRRPYRAPELGDAAISAAGDRFSLAALAYEWMTGRRAPSTFVAGDMAAMAGADRGALGRIFARALHADPDERYETCEAFIQDLAGVEVEEAAVGAPEKPRADSRPRKRSGRTSAAPGHHLPLDVSPVEEAGELPRTAVDARARQAEPPPSMANFHSEAAAVQPEAADFSYVTPAASAVLRPPPPVEPPLHSLLRDSPPTVGPPARSGGLRLVLALLLGAALGMGMGYAAWGREGLLRSPGSDPGGRDDVAAAAASAAGSTRAAAGDEPSTGPPASATGSPPSAAGSSTPPATQANPPAAPDLPPATTETPAPAAAAPGTVPPAATAPAGNLLVRSTPAGATVFVDDHRRGVTPLALQNVELGTRRVRIQRDGFTVEERQVNLTRSRPSRSVDVRLTRAAPAARTPAAAPAPDAPAARTGSLVIESRPTGATITLNGRQIGTTPMTIDDLEPGTYTVQLQLPTFRPIRTTVRVVAGARARAAASLVSAQEPQ